MREGEKGVCINVVATRSEGGGIYVVATRGVTCEFTQMSSRVAVFRTKHWAYLVDLGVRGCWGVIGCGLL